MAAATLATLALITVDQPAAAQQPDSPELTRLSAEARNVIKPFAGGLLAELKGAIDAGGPVAAIEACNLRAPALAAEAARASGWQVGRTAQKVRNPANAPDAWEARVLQDFVARAQAGADPATLERAEIVSEGGRQRFRFMKAITTADMCTTCHGASLKPEVAARVHELYPADQATGFAVGDLRGAFTLSRPLD